MGWCPRGGQVENREPAVTEDDGRRDEHAGVVRATVLEQVGHLRDDRLVRRSVPLHVETTGDPAQSALPLSDPLRDETS